MPPTRQSGESDLLGVISLDWISRCTRYERTTVDHQPPSSPEIIIILPGTTNQDHNGMAWHWVPLPKRLA